MDSRDSRRTGPPAPCKCCGEVGLIMARGLQEKCYTRVMRYGGEEARDKFPPMRKAASYDLESEAAIKRALAYWELRSGAGALGRNRACSVLGISTRTAHRYEAWIRAQQEEE